MMNQQYQEPWLAVVVDPVRTMASGKVETGAFRTYPEGYKPPDEGPSEYQTIPLNKIEDFGVHAKQVTPAPRPDAQATPWMARACPTPTPYVAALGSAPAIVAAYCDVHV